MNPNTAKPESRRGGWVMLRWGSLRSPPTYAVADLRKKLRSAPTCHTSFLINSNHSLYVVQKLLGHTQIKTTARYSHLVRAPC